MLLPPKIKKHMPFFRDIFQCFFVWRVAQATMQDIAQADAIVTMAQGLLKNGKPSPGDMVLANVVRDLHRRFPDKPIIPQEPVALAAPEIPYIAVAKPPQGNTLGFSTMAWNTRTVARFDATVCLKNGWRTVAFVATPYSQPRTQWELERCGLRCMAVSVPPYSKKLYDHPLSIYWYGRGGAWRDLLVEALRGRLHYLSYWILPE